LEFRTVAYYFQIVANLEIDELKKAGVCNDNLELADKFKDKEDKEGRLNEQGRSLYYDIKVKVLRSVFKDYLYLQHLEFEDDSYVLFFSMAGFDDTEFQILRWKKKNWEMVERISRELVDSDDTEFDKVAFNYDEGPKNLDSVRMSIKGSFLVLERGGLYHSCYDLIKRKLLINEESPWHACDGEGKEAMNKWIKLYLHDKIEQLIK
jgi:hypothetical protein